MKYLTLLCSCFFLFTGCAQTPPKDIEGFVKHKAANNVTLYSLSESPMVFAKDTVFFISPVPSASTNEQQKTLHTNLSTYFRNNVSKAFSLRGLSLTKNSKDADVTVIATLDALKIQDTTLELNSIRVTTNTPLFTEVEQNSTPWPSHSSARFTLKFYKGEKAIAYARQVQKTKDMYAAPAAWEPLLILADKAAADLTNAIK